MKLDSLWHKSNGLQQYTKRYRDCDSHDAIQNPEAECEPYRPLSPGWYAHKHNHFDDRGEAHGNGPQEETIDRVIDHDIPDLRPYSISCDRNGQEGKEKSHVEDEEDDSKIMQPVCLPWYNDEQVGHDACTHRHAEP